MSYEQEQKDLERKILSGNVEPKDLENLKRLWRVNEVIGPDIAGILGLKNTGRSWSADIRIRLAAGLGGVRVYDVSVQELHSTLPSNLYHRSIPAAVRAAEVSDVSAAQMAAVLGVQRCLHPVVTDGYCEDCGNMATPTTHHQCPVCRGRGWNCRTCGGSGRVPA